MIRFTGLVAAYLAAGCLNFVNPIPGRGPSEEPPVALDGSDAVADAVADAAGPDVTADAAVPADSRSDASDAGEAAIPADVRSDAADAGEADVPADASGRVPGTSCHNGVGACLRDGVWVAQPGGRPPVCSAPAPGTPTNEVCDGYDNDCDGTVDEGCICSFGAQRSCYTGAADTRDVGACRSGTQACLGTTWDSCRRDVVPRTEICRNLVDDDCDGLTDEDSCAP